MHILELVLINTGADNVSDIVVKKIHWKKKINVSLNASQHGHHGLLHVISEQFMCRLRAPKLNVVNLSMIWIWIKGVIEIDSQTCLLQVFIKFVEEVFTDDAHYLKLHHGVKEFDKWFRQFSMKMFELVVSWLSPLFNIMLNFFSALKQILNGGTW